MDNGEFSRIMKDIKHTTKIKTFYFIYNDLFEKKYIFIV